MEFIESGLHFRFGEEWVIKKYDAHRFYQGLSGSGLKGVDFLGILGEGLFLFEIKNFRRRRQWQEENPLEAVLDHPSEFAENIAYKVEDTLLAIDAIWQYYNRKWLFRRLLPVVLIGVLAKPFVFQTSREHNIFWPGFIALVGAALLLIQGLLIKFFGDVARYTVASPGNIVPRQKVRDRGVELINKLTASGQYDRIILVAHSLGCLIAYDILCLLWADYVATRRKPELVPNADAVRGEVQEVIEAATRKPIDLRRFRRAQRALFRALRKADDERLDAAGPDEEKVSARWLISDLVTIANPLTHAEFLLAPKKKQLGDRFRWRELSRCPPRLEEFRGRKSFVYQPTQGGALRFNHDAVFSVVRWTSIHDRPEDPRLFLTGDFISGPVSGIFGPGVVDVKVQPRRKSGSLPQRLFTHTIYWELKQADYGHAPRSVSVIRNALNILDESKREDALLKDANRAVGEAGG